MRRKDDNKAMIKDVLYVPSMKSNIISIGQLLENGFSMSPHQENLEVYDSRNRKVLKALLSTNRTFQVTIGTMKSVCLSTESQLDKSWLWHMSNVEDIERLKDNLKHEFEMIDLDKLSYFLGIEFAETKEGIVMHQKKYIKEVMNISNMEHYNDVSTPVKGNLKLDNCEHENPVDNILFRQLVDCLRFICNNIPEISYGVCLISRFMSKIKQTHLVLTNRILRYLKGTINCGILFPYQTEKGELQLAVYTNSNWCGDKVERRSTSGYVFLLGGPPIS
ncbi:PREDICTED: uncharacterized protein LOC109335462 [Lupinus angustifolius]|uniref:uncharacterized protein LOC109335462 n=1 Tax=Lupinus angustifolius TaxID=3871 RepID=UPI00092FC001|nr:PREDICTED: uncharacterized protein LOC109335462 [Lupinus angustifolius]